VARSSAVNQGSHEPVGSVLRSLVQELAAERRRVAVLERKNRELRAQIDAAQENLRTRDASPSAPRLA
jgi:hypothetical protein